MNKRATQPANPNEDEAEVECIYCHYHVTERDNVGQPSKAVPDSDNNEAWEELAREHGKDCEWIETRAHSLN